MKYHATIFAFSLLLTACSSDNSKKQNLSGIPILEIAATHAIATDSKVTNLAFSPNNIAASLGRIILNNDPELSSTDIEGRTAMKISAGNHADIYGLARENQAGVFFAINRKNKSLEAFIESDDEGNFKPLSYSGENVSPESFCQTDQLSPDQARILTTNNEIATLTYKIAEGDQAKLSPVEQTISERISFPKDSAQCAFSGSLTYTLSAAGNRLDIYDSSDWSNTALPMTVTDIAPLNLGQSPFLLMLSKNEIYLFNVDKREVQNKILIKSGLSIGGLEKASFIKTTTSNFGGGAFNEGLVAFGQADDNRIVFVSLPYLANTVLQSASE